MSAPVITLIGGPTALIEANGFRLLTDPTFDPPGEYALPHVTLKKLAGPTRTAAEIGRVRYSSATTSMPTISIAPQSLCNGCAAPVHDPRRSAATWPPAKGLAPWQSTEISKRDGSTVQITATPARHGPAGIEPLSGDVIGFMVSFSDGTPSLYVTGDTVWYDGVAEVARRFRSGVVLLFAGAARTRGPFNLTMNTNDAIETAHAFADATIVPIHCNGWAHFTQSGEDLAHTFEALGIAARLRLLEPGVPTTIEPRPVA